MEQKGYIKKAMDFIEMHLCDAVKVADVAKQSHFSTFHFNRLFHQATGASVMEYVRERRLTEAAAELAGSDEKITDLAFKYQFNSEEAFSRAFKKRYGASPRGYRNTQREILRPVRTSRVISSGTALCRAA